jgi:ABC-type glycerol-3-phosphate transport system permease component
MIIFVFFQFFSILAVSMSMAAILKKSTQNNGVGDVRYCFAMAILVLIIIILLLSFFRQKFVRHISRRCLDQTL